MALRIEYGLTRRELEVLAHLSYGHKLQRIAELMHIQRTTVDKHTQSIYTKMDVHNAAHAVATGIRTGLID